jgi:MoxR-vWA-beta-propeller ternary system domain bpX3
MTISIPFQLRRCEPSQPATALFLPSREPALLFTVCEQLAIDPTGRAFAIAGGFLLKLDEPSERPMPGLARLRSLHDDFYIPVDAKLLLPLLEDEMSGLVRDGGIVLLPGDRALRYDRKSPIAWTDLLTIPKQPLPTA